MAQESSLVSLRENTLFYGDNLDILRDYIPAESIDLVYLDPPFNSQEDYNILFRESSGEQSTAQIQAFSDFWHWDDAARKAYNYLTSNNVDSKVADLAQALHHMLGKNDMTAYLFMMTERLIELHRVLRPTGSLYIHCDPTASHYLKITLDAIFDPRNFRNEIIWRRTGSHGAQKSYGPIHDTVLFFSKTDDYYFKVIKQPYMKGHVESRFSKDPSSGKMKFTTGGNILTGSGATGGESGQPWKGFDPSAKNRHWAVPSYLAKQMPAEFQKLSVLKKLDALHERGLIEIKEGSAWPIPVRYFDESQESDEGHPTQDIWAYQPYTEGTVYGTNEGIDHDVAWLGTTDPERLGYQTQKPLGLLERIIQSSCPERGIVLDPFCGCGTTVTASEKLHRYWIGIDITFLAVNLVRRRLKDAFPSCKYNLIGEPKDIDAARELSKQRYQFQWWATDLIGARPVGSTSSNPKVGKKGADEGVDGWLRFPDGEEGNIEKIVVQVKSGHVSVKDIRELRDVMNRQKAVIGIFLTLEEPTSEMMKETRATDPYVSPTWKHEYPSIQILTIEQLLKGERPNIPLTISSFQESSRQKRSDSFKDTKLF